MRQFYLPISGWLSPKFQLMLHHCIHQIKPKFSLTPFYFLKTERLAQFNPIQ